MSRRVTIVKVSGAEVLATSYLLKLRSTSHVWRILSEGRETGVIITRAKPLSASKKGNEYWIAEKGLFGYSEPDDGPHKTLEDAKRKAQRAYY